MKRSLIFLIVLIVLVAFTGGLGYFQFFLKPQMVKEFIAKAAPPPTAVAVTVAKKEIWEPRLPAVGSFRAYQGIDVAPQVGGIIWALRFQSGQEVQKGAPLVQIDDSVEQADLKNNLATLKNTELALERQRQLVASGNTPKANFDSAEAARDSAAASVERVRATIAQKALAAPFAGRLGIRKVDVGQYVSPGTAIVTLQQLDPMFVDFPLPEQSLAELKIDQTVEVQVDPYPNVVFRGKIRTIDARVSSETRNVLVRGEIENKDRRLLPGMFAQVNVIAGQPREFITLPRTAVSFSLYGDSVYIVKPLAASAGEAQAASANDVAMKVERRFERTGDTRGENVAILEGVNPGETVVTQGQLKLQNDMRVRINPNANLQPPTVRPKE